MNIPASRPKVKWRKHEMIWVGLVTLIAITRCCWDWITLTPQRLESDYLIVYNDNNTPFSNYCINVWLPQISSILIFYLSYLAINLLIIPSVKRISSRGATDKIIKRLSWLAVQLLLLIFLILLGTNLSMYLAHPHLFNYGGIDLSSVFGYDNNHTLTYVLGGFPKTIGQVAVIFLLASMREIIIRYLEGPALNKAYWTLVVNQLTAFAVIYFSILYLLTALNFEKGYFLFFTYIFIVPSVFLIFMSNTYWLFPGGMPILSYRVLPRLLLSTFICTFPFFAFKDPDLPHGQFILFLVCWTGQVFVTTPLSWLIYQRRKDRILHLRGMEKELVKTQADLQFLRTQLNPHFLFNALNTLYGIALREKSPDTAKGIQMLGDMMSFMLHDNALDLIPMQKEIEYLENYIVLQKLRMQTSPDISVEMAVEGQHCDHLVAPMLLIPFVENAFKHGISFEETSWIKISLSCDEKNIRFEARNSLHSKAVNDQRRGGSGIGLKNVLKRLELTYPGRHQVDIGDDGREFLVRLVIQP